MLLGEAAVLANVIDSFANSLKAEKAPYVITLFVALLGWTALRTSDRLHETPFVEYQTTTFSTAPGSKGNFAAIRLRNVTSGQTFDCFILEQLASAKFGDSTDQRIIYRGNVAANTTLLKAAPANWQWEVRDFMPGADLELGAPTVGSEPWNVLVRPCQEAPRPANAKEGSVKSKGSTPVLMERSLVTRYVEHELPVLWAGLVLWLLFLVYLNAKRSSFVALQIAPTPGPSAAQAAGPATPDAPAPETAP